MKDDFTACKMRRRSVYAGARRLMIVIFTVIATIVVYKIYRKQFIPPRPIIKIDWHDYDKISREGRRQGVGEHGQPATLPPDHSVEQREKLYKENGFNAFLSDQIALDRSLPDIRHFECRKKRYLSQLPTVSVIVPFHNEHLSTLLRTATSVITRSPSELLKEIILVDDASTKEILGKDLESYLEKNLPKVRLVRLNERSGLIRARLAGAKRANADVLVFLDSHTEANVNWLPPLLEPIAQDYRTCVCPFIDVIAYDTFEYRAQDEGQRGAFDWEFYYKRLPLLPEDLKRPTDPFKNPVMAGGLFAISAKFFWELGGYDPGLDIWGGEQYELSFKIWQCGGMMVDAPCSRVGHIYRKFAPFPNPGRGDFVGKNYKRVAEVWMDEYAEYLYMRRPQYRNIDPGDLTEQRAIRTRLNCKPFKWFIENIAFDLVKKYPPIEPPDFGHGHISSLAAPDLCVDAQYKKAEEEIGLGRCRQGKEQIFHLTWHKDIRLKKRTMCWDVSSVAEKSPVTLYSCHGMKGNQLWRYNVETSQIIHGGNPRCLEGDGSTKKIYVTDCDESKVWQKWNISSIDLAAIANWENID